MLSTNKINSQRITRTLPATEGSQAAARRLRHKKQQHQSPSRNTINNKITKENEYARNISKQIMDELFHNVNPTSSTVTNPLTNAPSAMQNTTITNLTTKRNTLQEEAKSLTSTAVKEILRKSEALLQRTTKSTTTTAVSNEKHNVPIDTNPSTINTTTNNINTDTTTAIVPPIIDSRRSSIITDTDDTITTENDSVMDFATNRVIARILSTSKPNPPTTNNSSLLSTPSRANTNNTVSLLPVIPATPPPIAPSPSTVARKQFTRNSTTNILPPAVPNTTTEPSLLIPHPPSSTIEPSVPTVPVSAFSHPPSVSRRIIHPNSVPSVPPSDPTTMNNLQSLSLLSSSELASLVISLTNRLQEYQQINLHNAQIAADQLIAMNVTNKTLEDQYTKIIEENIQLQKRIQQLEFSATSNSTSSYMNNTYPSNKRDSDQFMYEKRHKLHQLQQLYQIKLSYKLKQKYYQLWKQNFHTEDKGYAIEQYIQQKRKQNILNEWKRLVQYRIAANTSFEQRIIPSIIQQSLLQVPVSDPVKRNTNTNISNNSNINVSNNSQDFSLEFAQIPSPLITTTTMVNTSDVSVVPTVDEYDI